MKQGSGNSRMGDTKPATRTHAVSPAYTGQIGTSHGNHVPERAAPLSGGLKPMYSGRGFSAPSPVSTTTHRGGSQGRHK